ncbi:trichohyalin-like isoform X2 [Camellia sinensis]|uniref:trichohyalin-like isoform X2 n=1 Tax=Camellia sinensis TaxID=4442 RepID=UPI001036D435|nr:trichohyalin-like isoform X2 [Camellia sinensis]
MFYILYMFYLIYILVYYLESDNGGQRESERRTARRQKTKETMTIDKKEQICEIERERRTARDDLPERRSVRDDLRERERETICQREKKNEAKKEDIPRRLSEYLEEREELIQALHKDRKFFGLPNITQFDMKFQRSFFVILQSGR